MFDYTTFVLIGLLIFSVAMGVHIVIALGMTSIVGVYLVTGNFGIVQKLVGSTSFEALRNYVFAVIPLFMLMGEFISKSGAITDVYRGIQRGLRRLPGRLAFATVLGNAIFSFVTGVSIASAAAFTRIAYPEMKRHKYNNGFSLAAITGSSCLGMLIPPSVLMIVWGILTERSIGQIFLAGVLPGLLLTSLFIIYIFTFILSGALIPLIVFSSRGASIGTLIVLVYSIHKNRRALVRSKILFLGSSLIFLVVLTLTSIYLDWTKIDFGEINTEVAIESLEMTLVSKRYPETVKPTFYIENNRLNSGDGNLNWRLQIWQDVSSDLYKKNKLISGYGFKTAIPAMEEQGRSGLDGTNIHVHNYFVNILARGGVIHLLLFIIFYAILITKFKNMDNGKGVVAFIVGVLFVSFFDSSMESVRFPFLFYIILSYKLKKE